MPRIARKESMTDYYHVVMRGNNKAYIFNDNKDKQFFKNTMFLMQKEGLMTLVAWCIMDNHIHLVVYAKLVNLSLAMKRINIRYAKREHRKEHSVGHVFQDRFMSEPIEDDPYLMEVVRYVHNNPVKAKMVQEPLEYKWSSIHAYHKGTLTVPMQMVFGIFGNSWKTFYKYHFKWDNKEFLDTKEDLERFRLAKAQRIIDLFCRKYGFYDRESILSHDNLFQELVVELRNESGLTLRKICAMLEVPYHMVQQAKVTSKRT